MSAIKSSIAAAVLLAIPAVYGEGFTIQNSCPFDIYYKVTTDSDSAIQAVSPGASSNMPYTGKADGGGPSVKVSQSPAVSGDILQMEYTMVSSLNQLFYDISNIDGLPFGNHNVKLSTNKACPTVSCAAGVPCEDAYNVPSDNHATQFCPLSGTDTTLTLCSDQTGNSGSSGSGSGSIVGDVAGAVGQAVSQVAQAPAQAQAQAPAPSAETQPQQAAGPAVNDNVQIAAATTLSTSVVPAATPSAAAQAQAAPAQAAPAAPVAQAAQPASEDDGDFSVLHFPSNWGQQFSSDADNFDELDNKTKHKRSSRVHRHHKHLAARLSA